MEFVKTTAELMGLTPLLTVPVLLAAAGIVAFVLFGGAARTVEALSELGDRCAADRVPAPLPAAPPPALPAPRRPVRMDAQQAPVLALRTASTLGDGTGSVARPLRVVS